MKKATIVLLVLLLCSSFAFSAGRELTGLGIYGSVAGSPAGNTGTELGLSLKFGNFPVLGLEYSLESPRFAVSCDYWVWNDHLGDTILWYYIGIGGFGGIVFDNAAVDLGARLPIGIQVWPLRKLELFLEFAPMLRLLESPDLDAAASLGLRVHF